MPLIKYIYEQLSNRDSAECALVFSILKLRYTASPGCRDPKDHDENNEFAELTDHCHGHADTADIDTYHEKL